MQSNKKNDKEPTIGIVFVKKSNMWLAYKKFNNGESDIEKWFFTRLEAQQGLQEMYNGGS